MAVQSDFENRCERLVQAKDNTSPPSIHEPARLRLAGTDLWSICSYCDASLSPETCQSVRTHGRVTGAIIPYNPLAHLRLLRIRLVWRNSCSNPRQRRDPIETAERKALSGVPGSCGPSCDLRECLCLLALEPERPDHSTYRIQPPCAYHKCPAPVFGLPRLLFQRGAFRTTKRRRMHGLPLGGSDEEHRGGKAARGNPTRQSAGLSETVSSPTTCLLLPPSPCGPGQAGVRQLPRSNCQYSNSSLAAAGSDLDGFLYRLPRCIEGDQ
jgi:hypothetical protein